MGGERFMDEEQDMRERKEKRKAGGQTNEEVGRRGWVTEAAFIFLLSLRAEGHRGVFSGRGE